MELTDPDKHTGVVLEAPKGAALLLRENDQTVVKIQDVPYVRLNGFLFRALAAKRRSVFLLVRGKTAGVVLEDLNMENIGQHANGVFLHEIDNKPEEPPLVVRRCSITVPAEGIQVFGPLSLQKNEALCRGIVIQDNRITGRDRGIYFKGGLSDVTVAGNLLWGSQLGALQVEDPSPQSRGILIANNTATRSEAGFRVWMNHKDAEFHLAQLKVCGNVLVDHDEGDAILYLAAEDGRGDPSPALADKLIGLWRFEGNWRDLSGNILPIRLPLSPGDCKAKGLRFVSTDPKQPGFMEPVQGSPLATGGLGAKGPWLPEYAGAVPPKGVPPWDWSLTWRARRGSGRQTTTP